MRGKKTYIILIAIVIVFFIIMFLIFGIDVLKREKYDITIIVENDTVWTYKNRRWSNVDSFSDYNWKKYDIYLNNVNKGNYSLWYSDKWYAFDDNKKAVKLDGSLLAIKSNINIPIYDYDVLEIDDYSYVDEVLEDNDLSISSQYTVSKKIILDIDNDGENEEFYIISNAFPMDFNPNKIFSIVFMVKNGEIYPIYNNISKNTGFTGCRPYFSGFLDIDEDSKYEVILSCAEYSVSGVSRMLYKYENNEFKKLISNNN